MSKYEGQVEERGGGIEWMKGGGRKGWEEKGQAGKGKQSHRQREIGRKSEKMK